MAYGTNNLGNGDILNQGHCDTWDDSLDYVRNEADFKTILNFAMQRNTDSTNGTGGSSTCIIKINNTLTVDTSTGTAAETAVNVDITSIADGLATIEVSGGSASTLVFRFMKTPDMDYVSVWYKRDRSLHDGAYTYTMDYLTMIAHRTSQGSW